MPLQKGKNAIIRGNGRWRGIREADYKRTKAGDKDKGDSALTVLSVRHLVHSIFGTRHFHFWEQSFSKAFFSEWLDVRFLENLRVMLIKKRQVQHSHRVFHEAAPAFVAGIGRQSVFYQKVQRIRVIVHVDKLTESTIYSSSSSTITKIRANQPLR